MTPVPEHEDLSFPFGDGGCFGCSKDNPDGLHLRFRRVGEEIRAPYRIADRFHGAPGLAHGGILATILDEFSCAAAVFLKGTRVVTGELTVRYLAPCPVEQDLVVVARVLDDSHARYFEVESEVAFQDSVVARSRGRFFRAPVEAIADEAGVISDPA